MAYIGRINNIVEELYSIIVDIDNFSEVETEEDEYKITRTRDNLKEVIYKLYIDNNLTGIKINQIMASLGYKTYQSLTYS